MSRFAKSAAAAGWLVMAAAAISGCGGSGELRAVSHRHTPSGEARIVVLPIGLPSILKMPASDQRTLGSLCATELLRSYEILEFERFERMLGERKLKLEDVLTEGTGKVLAQEMGVDALLVSEIYSWKPGKPGLPFLAKKGAVGYQGRLVDLASGSLLWSVNRVMATKPTEPLAVAASRVFGNLVEDMPRGVSLY